MAEEITVLGRLLEDYYSEGIGRINGIGNVLMSSLQWEMHEAVEEVMCAYGCHRTTGDDRGFIGVFRRTIAEFKRANLDRYFRRGATVFQFTACAWHDNSFNM